MPRCIIRKDNYKVLGAESKVKLQRCCLLGFKDRLKLPGETAVGKEASRKGSALKRARQTPKKNTIQSFT